MSIQPKIIRWLAALLAFSALGGQAELATAPVQRVAAGAAYVADGTVEAVRQSVLSAQVAGRVLQIGVKAGDRVAAGQLLVQVDARTATQQLAANRAQLDEARAEYERSRQLFNDQFISRAAFDRAEARYKALLAQTSAADTQTTLHSIHAPYAGVVAGVDIEVGDMALPGKPLLTLYDPADLRVAALVPESVATKLQTAAAATVEIPAAAVRYQQVPAFTVLPTADAATHTVTVRLPLHDIDGISPGQFARAHLPLRDGPQPHLLIPLQAVVRRVEFNAVYVVNAQGRAQLRQVRLGRPSGNNIEVLAGLSEGERVALDPLAAARQ